MKGNQLIIGILLILAGAGMVLDRIGIFGFGSFISVWWPMLIVIFGVIQISRRAVSYIWGSVIIIIGALLQLNRLDIINRNWTDFFWPLVLIVIGLSILFPEGRRRNIFGNSSIESQEDYLERFNIFSGSDIHYTSRSLRGGSITVIFGGSTIDLTDSYLSGDGAVIDAAAIFGGIDIIVPEEWRIETTGVPVFGGWSNRTKNKNIDMEGPVLRIRCTAIFGGIDVKNHR